jgi:hypothetical protein
MNGTISQRYSTCQRSKREFESPREAGRSSAARETGALPQTPGFSRHDRTEKSWETKKDPEWLMPHRVLRKIFSVQAQLSLVELRPRRARLRFAGLTSLQWQR